MSATAASEPVMMFGRFKGKRLSEIGRGYLCMLCTWDQLWPETRELVLEELRRRGLPFGKHKGVDLGLVPIQYLQWLRGTVELGEPYGELIDAIIE